MHQKYNRRSSIFIDGIEYRPIEYRNGIHHAVNVVTHSPYVHAHPDGMNGLLTDKEFDRLLLSGRLRIRTPRLDAPLRLQSAPLRSAVRQACDVNPRIQETRQRSRQLVGHRRPNHCKAAERHYRMIKDAPELRRSTR